MSVRTGLDRARAAGFSDWKGKRVAALCHHASVSRDLTHLTRVLREAKLDVRCIFSPEHGLWGGKDTRIPNSQNVEPRSGYLVHSLYGQTYRPTREMLDGVETLFIDLQDVGARFYTYTWSMAHCLDACAEFGVQAVVLDRPNPIGGDLFEGPVLEPKFSSFVGLHPVAQRHGMTHGEIATWIKQRMLPNLDLRVVECEGWTRDMAFSRTGLPWIPASPNMPREETARVYPGIGLLEGTDLSEGRGTTRPFEIFGHPSFDPWKLSDALNALKLPGAQFRALYYQPTWSKHARKGCGGAFLHVTDQKAFRPVHTAIALLRTVRERYPEALGWDAENRRNRFDRLAGCSWLREEIDRGAGLSAIDERIQGSAREFESTRKAALLYAT